MSDIYHLIDRLERLLNESWRMPLSAYLVINEDDFLDIIDQMRTAIPKRSRKGKGSSGSATDHCSSRRRAERIVHLAHAELQAVENHELMTLPSRGQTRH